MRRMLLPGVLWLAAWPAWAEMTLVMVEQDGCVWCARWDAEIAPAWPKTEVGQDAPLRRVDLHALPDDVAFDSRPRLTPTFVLVRDGAEIGRLEGYPGADFFWPVIESIVAGAKP